MAKMKEFSIIGIFEVDKTTGKKKLVSIRFPTETIRQLTDKDFIKSK
jgi:hypothetical protein